MIMRVTTLRRYPVKSMGGEDLLVVDLDRRGLTGDRWYAVQDAEGHLASGKNSRRFRRRDQVFAYAATSGADSVTVARGARRWKAGDPELDAELTRVMGDPVKVTPEGLVPHQDSGSVSLVGTASLDWCARRWGVDPDPRRLRVNIVFASDEPFIEESWTGREVAIGDAFLRVAEKVPRCRMIDIEQDGTTARGQWLKPLAREREMSLSVYADVTRTGVIRAGDDVSPL